MKHNVKTNLKLAGVCATAMMTLSGCGSKHTNIIEDVSQDKILVRDATDGKERIIELGKNATKYMSDGFKYFHCGDTINVVESWLRCGYQNDKFIPINDGNYQYGMRFNRDSIAQRKIQEIRQQEQTKFDSLKCVIARKTQEKHR